MSRDDTKGAEKEQRLKSDLNGEWCVLQSIHPPYREE